MNFKNELQKNRLVAAPLAGVTNSPFRKILRKYFNGIIYTEMISVEGLKRKNIQTMSFLDIKDYDHPIVLQLFGSNPSSFYDAVKSVEEECCPDGFDINFGCPVKKVVRSGAGSAVLKDIRKAEEIIKAVRRATDKEFSIKIRTGWDRNNIIAEEIYKIAEDNGVNALVIHGRTKSEMFSGEVDYDIISKITEKAVIPVIGNGNVMDAVSLEKMAATGADGIMIGRGMMKSPWIFKSFEEGKDPFGFLPKNELKNLLFEIGKLEKSLRDSEGYLDILKKYAVWFSKGFDNATDFRNEIYSIKSEEESYDLINKFFCD